MLDLTILTYNEAHRISSALDVAKKWANDIFIRDKCSTDSTVEIAKSYGCKIISNPFSRQGHEDVAATNSEIKKAKSNVNPWVLQLTPGEVPTKQFIETAKSLAVEDSIHDIILVPVRIHSFGRFIPGGPWSYSGQPRLINLNNAIVKNVCHESYTLTDKSISINDSDTCHIFHPTHVNFDSFIKAHVDYALAETNNQNLDMVRSYLQRAEHYNFEFVMNSGVDMRQLLAWKAYHYMVALKRLDDLMLPQTEMYYSETRSKYKKDEWSI